jgi:outer membrane biosynthesis protein TonB
MKKVYYLALPLLGLVVLSGIQGIFAQEQQPDVVIVKYGKLMVKSPVPEAKVYVDDIYKGRADAVIEDIPTGEHAISCRTEDRSASGTFQIRKDEVLKLEARYEEGKLVPYAEREKAEKAEKIEKPEPVKKPKVEAPKPEKPKKPAVEAKKEEKKSPVEERRGLHLNIIKVFFEDIDAPEARVSHKANPKVIVKLTEKKAQTGTYYRTKQNVLLCEKGPCEQQWSASFTYTDETGKNDSFGLTWKQTVFNGITPSGTSKRWLLACLNGACETLEDTAPSDTALSRDLGRYHLTWSKSSLIIRRSDIMNEVINSGGTVEAY